MFPVGLFVSQLILSSREIILHLVILTLLIMLLLAILICGLPNELPLRSLVELWLFKAPVWFQNLNFARVRLSI